MGKLDEKTIIITGGSKGIGYEIARMCVKENATVIILARKQKDLKNSLNKLKEISDKNHEYYSLDVANLDAVKKFVNYIKRKNLEISGLVNCAGIYGPIGKTININIQKFTEAIHINFLGTVYMCAAIAPILKSKSRKKIVNFSGGGAAGPFPNYSAYATSKTAIVRFTENLSIELSESNFDVNCISPGFVITRLHQDTLRAGADNAGNEFFEKTKEQIESRGVPPERAANLTVFLLSQDSDGIAGKFISAPWDSWQRVEFQKKLRIDKDFATLRRIDDKMYYKKNLS